MLDAAVAGYGATGGYRDLLTPYLISPKNRLAIPDPAGPPTIAPTTHSELRILHSEFHTPMRSIHTAPPLSPERLNEGRPILEPIAAHPWESRVVLNPAAVLLTDPDEVARLGETWELDAEARETLRDAGGACVLLYRAQGEANAQGFAPSSQGLAILTPDLRLVYRHPEPVLAASDNAPFHDLGVEDARCTKIGDTYYLYYSGFSSEESPVPWEHPGAIGRVQICLATTQNFRNWALHGPAEGLGPENDKNPALFAKSVEDKTGSARYYLLHRPMQGEGAMTIHLADAPSPSGPWTKRGPIFESHAYQEFFQSWIGAGGPPLPLSEDVDDGRFLTIYHQGHYLEAPGVLPRPREYDLAAALLDVRLDPVLRSRIEPLMRPTGDAETQGDALLGVDNVLFTCAAYRWQHAGGDDLILPYAASDSRIFGARIGWGALVEALGA